MFETIAHFPSGTSKSRVCRLIGCHLVCSPLSPPLSFLLLRVLPLRFLVAACSSHRWALVPPPPSIKTLISQVPLPACPLTSAQANWSGLYIRCRSSVPVTLSTMVSLSPRLLLAKLHDDHNVGRLLFSITRSIDRLRHALHSLFASLGGRTSAIHVARFKLLGRSHRLAFDIKFAEKIVKAYDRKKLRARNLAVRAGERMAVRIHMGDISGSSRRNAGSRAAQSKMSASLGSSKCKVFCRNIIMRNRKRSMSSRLSRPVVLSLNEGIKIILTSKWEGSRIAKKALKSCRKLLVRHDIKKCSITRSVA